MLVRARTGPQSAGAAAGVEVDFVGADGVVRRQPLSRSGMWRSSGSPVRGLHRSAGSATGRVGGGLPLPVSLWGMSPGWSGIG